VKFHNICGVDYGSRMAGTTVLAYMAEQVVHFEYAEKKQCADTFLKTTILALNLEKVYIDAPLSIPGVFANQNDFSDYFYRESDKSLKAMSPMFLGGLTARAMQLKAFFERHHPSVCFKEVYPGGLIRQDESFISGYKQELSTAIGSMNHNLQHLGLVVREIDVRNWHAFDALLALFIGIKVETGLSNPFGNSSEGYIYV